VGNTMNDPSRIMQIGTGFWASKVLLSAVELELFTALAAGGMTRAELETRVGLHRRASADFLDALVALGLLERDGVGDPARYRNTDETAQYLDKASPSYLGGMLEMANARLYGFWGNLTDALLSGKPQNEIAAGESMFEALYRDPEQLEQFMAAMVGAQRGNFEVLAERFPFDRHRTLCDVGGASGALAIAVARRHPGLRCLTFDLPAVEPIARRTVEAAGLGERVAVVSGDFMADPLPRADVITMGNILHDWGEEAKRALIGKAFEALPAGGAFIAIENLIDDERRTNVFGLLMSLNMLIETHDGFDYSPAQFDRWCREAGFAATEVIALAGPTSAAIAYRS
jgi:precorrin-6B methylase 2